MSSSDGDEGSNVIVSVEEEASSESEDDDECDESNANASFSESEDDDFDLSEEVDEETLERKFERKMKRIVANDPTLTRVDFDGWEIGDERARRLIAALPSNTFITQIWLANIGITATLLSALVDAVANSTSLIVLDLCRNAFGDEGARAVARFLRINSSLVKLHLENCGIGEEGAVLLAEALLSNTSLAELYLYENNIGDEGASAFARVLPGDSTLILVDLDENGISDVGARDLAEALPVNSSLTRFSLMYNDITDVGGRLLAKALLVNSTVIALDLSENDTSLELVQLVTDLASINDAAPSPEEAHRLKVIHKAGWLIDSKDEGNKEEAVTLALDSLNSFPQADQRRPLFERLLGSPEHGVAVAESVDDTTARTLYQYAADCGAAPSVLMNLLRAHNFLCTCRDVRHHIYPFMLLATMSEAGAGDVMELLLMNPSLVESGISGSNEL